MKTFWCFLLVWTSVQLTLIWSCAMACCDSKSKKRMDKGQRKIAMEITQKQMLNALGLNEFPKPKRKVVPHDFMINLYNTLSKARGNGESYVNTVRGFVDLERCRSTLHRYHQMYTFNVSALPKTEKLIAAELRILRLNTFIDRHIINLHGTEYRAKIVRKRNKAFPNYTPFDYTGVETLDSFTFDISDKEPKWFVVDVKSAVQEWQKSPKKVHCLELRVESILTGKLLPTSQLGFSKMKRKHNQQALLVEFSDDGRPKPKETPKDLETKESLETNEIPEDDVSNYDYGEEKKVRRKRRSVNFPRREKCHRKQLYVDFDSLDWSTWVIAPRGYNAYYCQGSCSMPIAAHLHPTNHAIVQTMMNSVDRNIVPAACCSPNKLSAISMLFIDSSDNVVYKKYEGMVVDRCGCN